MTLRPVPGCGGDKIPEKTESQLFFEALRDFFGVETDREAIERYRMVVNASRRRERQ